MRRNAMSIVFAAALAFLVFAPEQGVSGQADKGTVLVTGDVLYPGEYPLKPGLTALELLTLAEGSPNDTVHSLIIRRGKNGEPNEVPFNASERLRPNDVLIVRGVYVLRPDEILQIDIAGHPEISGRYIVQDDGSIILPVAERLSVRNDSDFRRNIALAVSAKLRDSPKVDVTVAKPRGPRVAPGNQ